MTNITIFTPTYNRAKTLLRLYKSLLNQTDINFIWLVIDDGSTDNTKEIIDTWISENLIIIDYHYKDNGGKHSAMRLAYELTKTKYLLTIDSDDELTPKAVETFKDEWENIEKDGLENQFAEVSGLTYSNEGKLIGDFYFPKGTDFLDSTWHEMVLKFKNNNEHIVCRNLEKLRECAIIPKEFWLSDRINFFGESTLWARIGRKYKTRYINQGLRVYHYDGGESLLRTSDKKKGHYNWLVAIKFFLDENLDYYFWNPKYFFNLTLKFIISSIELKISLLEILREIKSTRFKVFYILNLPLGLVAWYYFKFIKKQFWF